MACKCEIESFQTRNVLHEIPTSSCVGSRTDADGALVIIACEEIVEEPSTFMFWMIIVELIR